MKSNVVLGSGISGLAAAYSAQQHGIKSTIFEARNSAGGLLDNFTINGFRFDNAVHLSFAEELEVRKVFDKTPYGIHEPDSTNWDRNIWLKHPVQNNIYPLPIEEKIDLISSLAIAPSYEEIKNYEEWLIHQYGESIARRWPMVYTEKYWTLPAKELGVNWIGQRIRRANLKEVLAGAFTDDTPNFFYAKEMRYPKEGGYKSFISSMIDNSDIKYNHTAININSVNKVIVFQNGEKYKYDNLVSTLPLPDLIGIMENVPKNIKDAASTLFATEIDLISVGFNKPNISPAMWFYIYDRDIMAARAYSPDWKSKDNVPEGCSSLQFEIYSSKKCPQKYSTQELIDNTIQGIYKMGLATDKDIIFTHHKHVKYGNVVFDIGMEQRRDIVREWVEAQGIHVAGRFGEWAYLWSNQAMLSGLRAGKSAFV